MTIDLVQQDKQHRLLALDASKSFIVQAPAGSGKTELLIQRFLTLLTHVKTAEEILAITFTKKAANEMRSRVIKALKQALNEPEPASDHEKQTWRLAKLVLQQDQIYQWNLIDNPNQLRIQTIDSLCSHLTKQHPLLSHFGSQPDITDQPAILYREAVQEVLMHVEEDYDWTKSITRLLLHLDNDLNKLHDLLVTLLSKRDQWLPYIQFNSNAAEIRQQLQAQLSLVITESLAEIKRLFPQELITEMMAIARFASAHVQMVNPQSEILACEALTTFPLASAENKRAYTGLAKLLLTKTFSWRKQVNDEIGFPALKNFKNPQEKSVHTDYRQRLQIIITKLGDHENLRLALTELFFLPDPVYTDMQWEILQSLLHVLKITAAQLRLTFQQHGQIDFIENTQAALAALGNNDYPTDLALALDYQLQHILIDEFQDTSYTQYQLLEKLTNGWETNDGRTLFVVGDPMQSIYRFREAEVGLFIRMRSKGMHHIELIPLTLAVNFRSSSSIVDWNNVHFNKIFPPFNDMASGAVSYSASVSHQLELSGIEKAITVRGFVNPAKESEAENIVALIQQTKHHHPGDKIAILVRSRSHLTKLIPALKKAGIHYRAIDIDPLESRQHIQDILSLTCALLHPADRIAWLAVLRAPWCGLTLADLLVVAGGDSYAAIITQLESTELIQKLSHDGRLRLEKILPIIKAKIAARERLPLRAWIESTWLLLGGPACLHDVADIEDMNAFFNLLDEFSGKNQYLNLDKLKEKISKLYASTQHHDASVDIMTIHTSKGLEFDTVIIPQLEKKNPSDDKSLLLWMEQPLVNDQIALLLAPIHATGTEKDALYEYIHRQQKIKADYETDRLFYVAATRAKKRLHLFFNVSRKDGNDFRIESGSFLGKIWPLIEKEKDHILTLINHDDENAATIQKPLRPIKRVKNSWINPVSELLMDTVASHKKQSGFQLIDQTPRLIGTATHRVLQILAELGINWWAQHTCDEKNLYLQALLRELGVNAGKLDQAAQSVLKVIENTLADERGKWILYPHANAKSEFALTALIDNQLESLVIDRTFIDEKNTLWIIDYKTTALSGENVGQFLTREQKKYAEQIQKYYQALRSSHDGMIRLGLYFPALPAWHEWES